MTTPASMTNRGFALVAVLLVLGMLGLIGAEFAYSMRLEATAARTYKEGIAAAHLAEDRRVGHAYILEGQECRVRGVHPELLQALLPDHPRKVHRHQE